jgi:hypothetical protein
MLHLTYAKAVGMESLPLITKAHNNYRERFTTLRRDFQLCLLDIELILQHKAFRHQGSDGVTQSYPESLVFTVKVIDFSLKLLDIIAGSL